MRHLGPAVIAVLVLTAAACTGSDGEGATDPTQEPPDRDARTAASAVVAIESFGNRLPWPWETSITTKRLWDVIYDPMIARDAETWELVPTGLVTQWEHNGDYTEWTFHLREGVMFHGDWGEFTSADVVYSVERNLDPEATGGSTGFFRERLDSITAPDPYTVVMSMNEPTWDLPSHFAQDLGYLSSIPSMRQIEEMGEEEAAQNPAGTGPYRHVGISGDEFMFEAVADHWRLEPGFERLTIREVSEQATTLAGLQTGEIDLAQVSGDFVGVAESEASLRVHAVENALQYWIVLSGQTTPDREDYCPECPWVGDRSDPESRDRARVVREALNLAVDRDAIVEQLWQGWGNTDPFTPYTFPQHPEHLEDWVLPEHDEGRAEQLLADAGYADGFEIDIASVVTSSAIDGPEIAEAVASDLERVGVTVNLVQEQWETLSERGRNRATGPTGWVHAATAFEEPANVYPLTASTTGPFPVIAENAEYDQIVQEFARTVDRDERAEQVQSFGQRLYDDMPVIWIGTKSRTYAMTDTIGEWPALEFGFETRLQELRS